MSLAPDRPQGALLQPSGYSNILPTVEGYRHGHKMGIVVGAAGTSMLGANGQFLHINPTDHTVIVKFSSRPVPNNGIRAALRAMAAIDAVLGNQGKTH